MLGLRRRRTAPAFPPAAPFLSALALVAFITLLLSPLPARAQPLADRVPADAVVYVGWQGADGLGSAYNASRLKAVLDATDARLLIDEFFPKLVERASQEDKQAGEVINLVTSLAKPMWQHPTAFAFNGIDWEGNPDVGPMPRMVLLCQAGPQAADLRDQIDGILKQGPSELQQLVKADRAGDLVAVHVGYKDVKAALADRGGNALNGADAFKSALAQVGKNPALVAYVDVEKAWDLIDKAADREANERDRENWRKVKSAAGLEGVKRFVWTSGFDGKDWSDQVFVAAPEPRKGLLKLAESGPVTDAALSTIPRSATLAGAARFDPAKLFDVVREIAVEIEPQAREQIDQGLGQVRDALKLDLEKDLLQALGDEWAYYVAPDIGGRGLMGFVVVNRLRDENKAVASLAKLELFANVQMAQQMKDEEVKLAIYQTKHGDLTIHYLGLPLVTPSWAIKDGNLYVALYPQVVASAAGHVSGKGQTILANPDFVAMRQRLGGQRATTVAFADLPRTAPDSYATWLAVSRLSGFADMFGVQSPAMLLPPLDKLLPQLTPAGSVTWTDKDGWHARAVSPFPGASALSSDPLGGMALQPLFLGMAAASERAGAAAAPHEAQAAPAPRVVEPEIREVPEPKP